MSTIQFVEKVWGSEEWIVNREYCGKLLRVKKDWQSSLHYHPIKHETFYLLDGLLWLTVDGLSFQLLPGRSVMLEPKTPHRFAGLRDSLVLEVSTHHDDNDVVRLEPSGRAFWTKSKEEEWKWLT